MQILRPPAHIAGGCILFRGEDIAARSAEKLRRYRWQNVSMVFQSAMNALNPVMRVGDQFVDMMRAHERISKREALVRAGELLDLVGIDARRVRAYPHELSGGHASASRDRDGARARAGARDHGRADDRARRRRAARDSPAGARTCSASSASRSSSSRTTSRCSSSSLTASRSCTRARSSNRPGSATAHERAPSVHPRADAVVPTADGADRAHDGHPRCTPEPRVPAGGMPLQPALPALRPSRRPPSVRPADLGTAAAARCRGRACGRLPPRRGGTAVTDTVAALEVRNLTKHFPTGEGLLGRGSRVHAADDVSFTLRPGTITALVGESGSGKSTVARLLARLYDPTSGEVIFAGRDIADARSRRQQLEYRSEVQMIFQDPFGSLNPVKTVRHHLARPLQIHGHVRRSGVEARVHELLETVGLSPPARLRREVPARVVGRPAAARRDRARARGRAVGDRRRRADLDARRVDSHRDPQPDARPEGAQAARVPLRHARSRERALRRRLGARHVRRPDRRARPGRAGSAAIRCIPIPVCCWRRSPIRRSSNAHRSPFAKGSPRRPSTRLRAAASSGGARYASTSAPR